MYLIEIWLICDSYFFDPCGRIHGVAARANRALTLEQFGTAPPLQNKSNIAATEIGKEEKIPVSKQYSRSGDGSVEPQL